MSEGFVVTEPTAIQARDVWEAMRGSPFPFALIDPSSHVFVDANEHYAALFQLSASELKNLSVLSLYGPETARSIEALHDLFARGKLESIRGQASLPRRDGKTIELKGWTRRIEGISQRTLIVTSAVEAKSEVVTDDRPWVAQAPHVFAPIATDSSPASLEVARELAEQLAQQLWRINLELRATGLLRPGDPIDPQQTPIRELEDLSPRQREIVMRLLAGERVGDIAKAMYLSPSTIRNHLVAVFRKFGVHSQVELVSVLKEPSGSR